ncbi:putative ABC transporter ATP-binding protein YybJ [Clostridia bacterium]|nr:putative ABC transporter ATP-binding protein YybJ [Clostridia bacterium]
MYTIEIRNLCKTIKNAVILEDINLKLESGNVYGFVGKNGSGKTMLFRSLAGLVHPTSGEVVINGKILHKDIAFVENLGLIIENVGLYPEFTGFKNLKLLAKINNKINDEQIKATIARVGLDPEDKRTVKKYSLGMRQRIVLAQALMESPDVLLLDEPTNGLDEAGTELIRSILREEVKRGALIAIASHDKEDIAFLCDTKYKMTAGRLEEMA